MRKTTLSFSALTFVLLSIFELHAATLAGVTMPDTAQVGSTKLWCSMASDCGPSTW